MKRSPYKDYLGDGVYADYDGYHIVLTTEDGIAVHDRICLDDSVYAALQRYAERIKHMQGGK